MHSGSPDSQGTPCHTFYWIPIRKLSILPRLANKLGRSQSGVVLDLEDSLWFPDDPIRTEAARASARSTLVAKGPLLKSLAGRIPLAVRINPYPGAIFELDSEALASLGLEWEWLFLPKVSAGRNILQAAARLAEAGIPYRNLVPILETRSALDGIEDILSAAVQAGLRWIQYGHQDFSLSAGHWPFWEQDDSSFQSHVERMVSAVEARGLNYIHTPYMHMQDREGFLDMQLWLSRICARPHGQATLSIEQTLACGHGETRSPSHRLTGSRSGCGGSPLDMALRIVAGYERNAHAGRSFSVDAGSGRFFSPQEYRAALDFVGKEAV